jgi:hypothetical protein
MDRRPTLPSLAATGLWIALIMLVALGIVSVALRWAFPADAAAQVEPLRDRVFAMLHRATGATAERRIELARFDGRYQAHPIAVLALTLTPAGLSAANAFVVALWIGWPATIAACEWWIRQTRPEPA